MSIIIYRNYFMAKSHFDPYKTIIKIIQQRQNLIFGICFQNPPNTLLLYKEHMYSLFLLLYCYGQASHKEMISQKVIECREYHMSKMKTAVQQHQQNTHKKLSKNIVDMLDYVQSELKKQQSSINLHTLKQRQYIRKSFKSIFQMQNKLNMKSEMNIIDFAKLAASLIDAYCEVKDYFDFQLIEFRQDQFDEKKLDVFIQIDKKNQTYRYIKQNRNPKLIENNENDVFQEEGSFMFKKMRIKRAQSIEESTPIDSQEEGIEEQPMLQSKIAESPLLQSSITRIQSKKLNYQPLNQSNGIDAPSHNLPDLLKTLSKNQQIKQQQKESLELKIYSKNNKPPSLKLIPHSSQFKHHKKYEAGEVQVEYSVQNRSENSQTKKLDVQNLQFENFGAFQSIKKEIKEALEKITLSQFLKGFNQNKLKQMPACFHDELAKSLEMKFKVESLDCAMQELAMESLSCQTPTPTSLNKNKSNYQVLKQASKHENLLGLCFKTLFNEESPIRESSKESKRIKNNPEHNLLPEPTKQHKKKPQNPQNSQKIHKSTNLPKTDLPNSSRSRYFTSSTPKKYDYRINQSLNPPHYFTTPRLNLQFQKQLQFSYRNKSGLRKPKYNYLANT